MKELQLHFVGIGGIGMSGIAEVFANQGFRVTGSDLADSDTVRRLISLGIGVYIGHRAENVAGAGVVVISSAVKADNPEVQEARRLRIPVIPRAEMLGELMRGKTGIAVAGSHGKTTTTSMLATVLTHAGLDPTLVIGGKVDSLGGNAKLGQGSLVVAEADESDGSFLHLPATYGVVTNIDNDHLDFFGDLESIEKAFIDFVAKLPFYGFAAVCTDDPGVRRCLARMTKPIVSYGTTEDADFLAGGVRPLPLGSSFEVFERDAATRSHRLLGTIDLKVPGKHNVLNALASVVIAQRLGVPFEKIAEGLRAFGGVRRRFDVRYRNEGRKQMIVDDYGHHPTEILATLAAARGYWPGRIVTIFQPHRYSRTLHCQEAFATAFMQSDVVLITDIYAAGEEPTDGISPASLVANLVEGIKKNARPGQLILHVGDLAQAKSIALGQFTEGDLLLCMGAGSITRLAEELGHAAG
jgi:UDP-N-acetylmuramate--alanine ligase